MHLGVKIKGLGKHPIGKMIKRGEFTPMTSYQILFEERMLLESLTLTDCFFMDTTVMDRYTIQGFLPEGKEAMLQMINRLLG